MDLHPSKGSVYSERFPKASVKISAVTQRTVGCFLTYLRLSNAYRGRIPDRWQGCQVEAIGREYRTARRGGAARRRVVMVSGREGDALFGA